MVMAMVRPTHSHGALCKLQKGHCRCGGRGRWKLVASCLGLTASNGNLCIRIGHDLREALNLLLKGMHLLSQGDGQSLSVSSRSSQGTHRCSLQTPKRSRQPHGNTPQKHPQTLQLG